MGYLVYNYFIDGGGVCFWEVYNVWIVEGICFVDYINYKFELDFREVGIFDVLFE